MLSKKVELSSRHNKGDLGNMGFFVEMYANAMGLITNQVEKVIKNDRTELELLQELTGFKGEAVLTRYGKRYFVISSIMNGPEGYGPETMAFEADKDGKVLSYRDLAGGLGATRMECMRQLQNQLDCENDK